MLFHFKKTYTSCTDEVRVKVPSLQNFTLFFYNIKRSVHTLSVNKLLFEDFTDCHDSR